MVERGIEKMFTPTSNLMLLQSIILYASNTAASSLNILSSVLIETFASFQRYRWRFTPRNIENFVAEI